MSTRAHLQARPQAQPQADSGLASASSSASGVVVDFYSYYCVLILTLILARSPGWSYNHVYTCTYVNLYLNLHLHLRFLCTYTHFWPAQVLGMPTTFGYLNGLATVFAIIVCRSSARSSRVWSSATASATPSTSSLLLQAPAPPLQRIEPPTMVVFSATALASSLLL